MHFRNSNEEMKCILDPLSKNVHINFEFSLKILKRSIYSYPKCFFFQLRNSLMSRNVKEIITPYTYDICVYSCKSMPAICLT